MGTYLWETIKEIRESHGLNKRQFADILGCSPTLIGYIEKPYSESHRVATVDIIHAIAKHFTNSEDERKALELDILPALKDGDSWIVAEHYATAQAGSCFLEKS